LREEILDGALQDPGHDAAQAPAAAARRLGEESAGECCRWRQAADLAPGTECAGTGVPAAAGRGRDECESRGSRQRAVQGADGIPREIWTATELLDELGLVTVKAYQRAREDVINRQQQEMLELSTPVVKLWDGILALPMIGTLDSARTQIVMESLLHKIVETSSEIAIIDITGVPTVERPKS
jgi:hypothetical protein